MLLRQLAISAPADNTCQWLYDTPSFKAWTERENVNMHHGLLQIIGKPGSGKSTLMRSIFEATRSLAHKRNDATCVVSHFFHSGGQTLESSTKNMFHSLIYQLASLYPPCLVVFKVYSATDLQTLDSTAPVSYLDVLRMSLRLIFSNRSFSPQRTVIFIDALDECDRSEAARTGYFFAELTKTAHKHGVDLNVCLSRREYPSITVQDCLEIRMESHNLQDIRQYISQKLDLVGVARQDANALHEAIVQRSNGIFLWVVLAVEEALKDFESGQNAKHILERAKSLPKELEELFAQILGELNPEELGMALQLFQWAVLPTSRLRIREWHHILPFLREKPPLSLKEWKSSEYYTQTDAQLEHKIRDLSRGLIEVKSGVDVLIDPAASEVGSLLAGAGSLDSTTGDSRVVQPIHETLVQFLTSGRANALFGQDRDYNFTGEGHLAIARACLDYISISELDELVAARKRQRAQDDNRCAAPARVLTQSEMIGLLVKKVMEEGPGRQTRPAGLAGGRKEGGPEVAWAAARNNHPLVRDLSLGQSSLPRLRRQRSDASFMSSASSHSVNYLHHEAEEVESPKHNLAASAKHVNVTPLEAPNSPAIKHNPCPPEIIAQPFQLPANLIIKQDEFGPDQIENFVIDMEPAQGQAGKPTQLFHLRMHDPPFGRKFSIYRCCRDSGHILCSTRREFVMLDNSHRGWTTTLDGDSSAPSSRASNTNSQRLSPTNVIRLEFSDSATVLLERRDEDDSICHRFEYGGIWYSWTRPRPVGSTDFQWDDDMNTQFRLLRDGNMNHSVACIDFNLERWLQAGAYLIPPCVMQIASQTGLVRRASLAK